MGDADGLVAADIVVVAIDDGEHTGIFKLTQTGATDDGGTPTAAQIQLLGILIGVTDATSLTANDFAF